MWKVARKRTNILVAETDTPFIFGRLMTEGEADIIDGLTDLDDPQIDQDGDMDVVDVMLFRQDDEQDTKE